jgi:hypothetical protein
MPKQTQYEPNLSCVASGEAGTNPTCSELVEPISGQIYASALDGERLRKFCFLALLEGDNLR